MIRARTNNSLTSTIFLILLAGIVELFRDNEIIVISEESKYFFFMVVRVYLSIRLAIIASDVAKLFVGADN